jgi:hypothetical protein
MVGASDFHILIFSTELNHGEVLSQHSSFRFDPTKHWHIKELLFLIGRSFNNLELKIIY